MKRISLKNSSKISPYNLDQYIIKKHTGIKSILQYGTTYYPYGLAYIISHYLAFFLVFGKANEVHLWQNDHENGTKKGQNG